MRKNSILLIHPPVAKTCEPPAGLAKLAGALKGQGADCRVYDANIDCMMGLLDAPLTADGTWTRRALTHWRANIAALRNSSLYTNMDRYKRAVMDVNRVLEVAGRGSQATLSLANYTDAHLTPVRSRDLIRCAESFDTNLFYPIFSPKLAALFKEDEPDIVGVSINFMSQALCAFAIIGSIRQMLPGVRIVCGGGLITSWMNIPGIVNPFQGLVDEMIGGPGEARLIQLGTGNRLDAAPLTGYDFSQLPMDRYLSPQPVLPFAASRGCWWKKCAFCPETAEDSLYETSNPVTLVNDLGELSRNTGARLIHLLDNALAPRLLEHVADHPLPAAWYGFARITRHLTDIDFLRRLRRAGCVMLKLGVESGDQAVLDHLGKGIDLSMVRKALMAIHQAGIATYVYLLFGTPPENEASARKTMDFTLAQAPNIDFLNLAIFNLPAHGQEAAGLQTMDFYKGDLSLYREFAHPRGWNRDRVRRFLSATFKKAPPIRTIIHRDPPFFTSNHAPFFAMHQQPTNELDTS